MLVIKNESTIFFDVDNTLIHYPKNQKLKTAAVTDPVSQKVIKVAPYKQHVRLLIEEHARGRFVVVWSRGGYAWAAAVVKALGLSPYVHQVISKPYSYVDDLPIEQWLVDRIYIPISEEYKT